ncbi:hypothetical protein TNCV_3080631 [Trichonephila clavipes]|nr:hypothetical protein TNCV_3080631 [Trichonephila clavipes]
MTRRKWYTQEFLRNHKNCSKEHPSAKMQASYCRWRDCQTLAKPRESPDIACYDGNPRNPGFVGVNGACVNKTLLMAPEEEV